ncbi:hypothetical protein Y1Q_0020368 [Alligator mississippiensis]|uniref:Uncharacterized protein n=1 Tax=Alligator mississippiensis TaxID=8496 RepID=A0A151N6F8_ALLMI|nr:hypothetical protein Y1Q_0020368 [Alligator mississippiensis]
MNLATGEFLCCHIFGEATLAHSKDRRQEDLGSSLNSNIKLLGHYSKRLLAEKGLRVLLNLSLLMGLLSHAAHSVV